MPSSLTRQAIRRTAAFCGVVMLASTPATAGETARFMNAPVTAAQTSPRLAVQLELKLRLPQGRGLARLLLDAGVDRADAATAARLAAGHLGDGQGGCDVQVSVVSDGRGALKLVRAIVMTQVDRTVIERRGAELEVASASPVRMSPRLV